MQSVIPIAVFLVFILVFLMNNAVIRNQELRRNTNLELSRIRRIHHLTEKMSGAKKTKWAKDVHTEINNYLDFFKQYSFAEYERGRGPFRGITHAVYSFKPKTRREEIIFAEFLSTTRELAATRQNIASLLRQRISAYRWVVLLTIEVLVIFSLMLAQGSSLDAFLANTALIATILIVTSLIWEMDDYSPSELAQFADLYVKNKESLKRERKH